MIPKRSLSALLIIASILGTGLLAAILVMRSRGSDADEKRFAQVNKPAPDFVLEKMGGGVESMAALRGKPVLLDFWTTWCAACEAEIPALEERQQKFRDKGLVVIAVHRTRMELQETAEAYMERKEPSFTVLLDRTDEVYQTYVKGGKAFPASVLIDRKGVVRSVVFGQFDPSKMDEEIAKIVR